MKKPTKPTQGTATREAMPGQAGEVPRLGGSYTRQPDGSLSRDEFTEDTPADAEPGTTAQPQEQTP